MKKAAQEKTTAAREEETNARGTRAETKNARAEITVTRMHGMKMGTMTLGTKTGTRPTVVQGAVKTELITLAATGSWIHDLVGGCAEWTFEICAGLKIQPCTWNSIRAYEG